MKNKRKYIWLAFALSLLLGTLIVIPNIILGGKGIYNLFADLNLQQIPFNKMINEAIKSGNVLWTWQNDLGSNFIGTFSFYNLFSPFNILGYLFPSSWFPYLLGPIFILKYAVAGLTSYLFLNRYVKNPKYAVIGSLLYSFSGFQLTNILFYHFHDVVAFFPLLLYTLDNLVYDNKKNGLILSLALNAFTNWFFLIGQIVFLGIYYIVKIITKEYKFDFKKLSQILLEGLLGIGLAALVLIPSFLFTLGNPRINGSWNLKTMFVYGMPSQYVEIIRALIFPPDIMSFRSMIRPSNFASVELYLPVVGSVLVFSYLLKNYKKWDSILLIVLFGFMLLPIFNSSFFAFATTYYARWFYMPILIMSLVSIKALEEKISIKKGLVGLVIGVAIFILLLFYWAKRIDFNNFIYNKTYFSLTIILFLVNVIATIFIISQKKEKTKLKVLLVMIFITVGLWGNYMIYTYKSGTFKTDEGYYRFITGKDNYTLDTNGRANSLEGCFYNSSYIYNIKNIYSWNSNINASAFKLYYNMGFLRSIYTYIPPARKDFNNFLGVKYIYVCNNADLTNDGYKLVKTTKDYKLYENQDAKPLGFILNSYISDTDFSYLTIAEKERTINNSVVLSQEQIKEYQNLFTEDTDYKTIDFQFGKNSFTSKIKTNKEALAVYTVPYDKGWTAWVNNKQVPIIEVDNGLMALKVSKGTNNIKFKYFPPGLKMGLILSILSLVIFILYYRKSKFFL